MTPWQLLTGLLAHPQRRTARARGPGQLVAASTRIPLTRGDKVSVMDKYLSRDQLGMVRNLAAESVKDLSRKGLLLEPDIVIGADFTPEELAGAQLDEGSRIRPRLGYLPVSVVAWERPGRGRPRRQVERIVRRNRVEPDAYSRDQLEAAARCVEAAYWVVVHLRREPEKADGPEWEGWNALTRAAQGQFEAARAAFDELFSDHQSPPTPEEVLGITPDRR